MTLISDLQTRSAGTCELCAATAGLAVYTLPALPTPGPANSVLVCEQCLDHIEGNTDAAAAARHWRCLGDSIWSEHTPVKVLAYRLLKRLPAESWAQDLLGQIYLDDDAMLWADGPEDADSGSDGGTPVVDSNGTLLAAGDAVTLIKDLVVKGANFTAKRGTVVKSIVLTDDPKYVEGRVNGTTIVLVAAYLKKA